MDVPTFISSYQTEAYEFCDKVSKRLDEILEDKTSLGHAYMRGEDTNGNAASRRDYSVNFTTINDPLVVEMHEVLRQWIPKYSEDFPGFASQVCMSEQMKVQKTTPKGGFHSFHCEQAKPENSAYRCLTWTLYLNDVPEGEGETEFLEYGIKVQPKKGLLSFFPAAWTHIHRGNPVYTKDKYIATGWYYLI